MWVQNERKEFEMSKEVKVWLVGAGPGSPGLLTIRARDVLSQAEVVLYDRLVNPALFTWAPETAKWIDAGKTPRGRRMEQNEIHRLLLRYAKKGKRVVVREGDFGLSDNVSFSE